MDAGARTEKPASIYHINSGTWTGILIPDVTFIE